MTSSSARESLRHKFSQAEGLNYIESQSIDQLVRLLQVGAQTNLVIVDSHYSELEEFKAIILVWDTSTLSSEDFFLDVDDKLKTNQDELYTSMPIHIFHHFDLLPVDIFIKMQKDSKSHFVRRFLANDTIQTEEIESFIKRGINELWVEKESLKFFSKELISAIKNDINHQSQGIDDIEVNERVFNSLGDMIKKVGIKPVIVDLCDTWMNNLAKNSITCMHSPVQDWFKRLTQDPKLDFHYKLVRLTTLLCGQYVLSTDWVSKDEQAARLAGVALFADMSLSDPSFIHYRNYDMVQQLKGDDRLNVTTHALRSSQLIAHATFLTKDISILVSQHHGCPDGERIPQKISGNISALAHVYILSEEIGYNLIKDTNLSISDMFEEMKKKYKSSPLTNYLATYQKILNIY